MDSVKMTDGAVKAGLKLDGPYSALLIKYNWPQKLDHELRWIEV
jgi:hypothetical protein